jgi:bacteriocin biosynthesis cyclodehydratase domain-containing protein
MDEAISGVARGMAVSLPTKPRLAPWIAMVDLGDNRLQLRSAELTFTFAHPFFADIFRTVEPLLDGRHTVEQIALAGGPDVLPTTVIFVLKMLGAHGVLHEGEIPQPLSAEELTHWDRQIRFIGHFLPDPLSAHVVLRQSCVALLATSGLKDTVRQALESLGIGETIDAGPPTVQNAGTIAAIKRADLLIVCLESPGFSIFETVNTACLEHDIRWLRAAIQGTTVQLGPTIVPGQTACYTCYDLRARSHVADLDGFMAYRDLVARQDVSPDEGALAPLWSVLAGQIALEVARILTGFAPPTTIGRFYELDARGPGAVAHDVLRLPRCPSCGSRQPVGAVWDDER